jgi:hypothetical protein
MLPLGRRVQDKLEALIDKHMYQLGESFQTGPVVYLIGRNMVEEWAFRKSWF